MKIKIGIIGAAEIAYRRFLPALKKCPQFEYVGVAISRSADKDKAMLIKSNFGGEIFTSYEDLINSNLVDALYIPQPPALHYKYAKMGLLAGKHILLEKPFTTNLSDTLDLLRIAEDQDLAVHENYMFKYHKQIDIAKKIIDSNILGDIREYRLDFGFPRRNIKDFRYSKILGGGALLDCGGYPLQLANILLENNSKIVFHYPKFSDSFDVDIGGNVILANDKNQTAYVGYGMDNSYQCKLFVWGSLGTLTCDRIFTAPPELDVVFDLFVNNEYSKIHVGKDDSFKNSILVFYENIVDKLKREYNRQSIRKQAELIEACK